MQPVFPQTFKEIGDVQEGQVIDIAYEMNLGDRIVSELSPDCGACTTMFNLNDKIIIRFVATDINPEVFVDGLTKEPVERGCSVRFTDGTSERLYFSGFIVPKNG